MLLSKSVKKQLYAVSAKTPKCSRGWEQVATKCSTLNKKFLSTQDSENIEAGSMGRSAGKYWIFNTTFTQSSHSCWTHNNYGYLHKSGTSQHSNRNKCKRVSLGSTPGWGSIGNEWRKNHSLLGYVQWVIKEIKKIKKERGGGELKRGKTKYRVWKAHKVWKESGLDMNKVHSILLHTDTHPFHDTH